MNEFHCDVPLWEQSTMVAIGTSAPIENMLKLLMNSVVCSAHCGCLVIMMKILCKWITLLHWLCVKDSFSVYCWCSWLEVNNTWGELPALISWEINTKCLMVFVHSNCSSIYPCFYIAVSNTRHSQQKKLCSCSFSAYHILLWPLQ